MGRKIAPTVYMVNGPEMKLNKSLPLEILVLALQSQKSSRPWKERTTCIELPLLSANRSQYQRLG